MSKPLIPGGYILLSRKIVESEIWNKPSLYVKVWIYLLSKAQHQDYKKLKRGQLWTSIPEIQEACSHYVGYRKETPTKDQIFRIIDWLRKSHEGDTTTTTHAPMITTTKATQGLLLNIVNYDLYQTSKNYERNNETSDEKATKWMRPQQRPDNINKNDKNDNNMLLSIYKGENPESYLQEYFPNFYQWIEKNNYTEKAKHPNEEPYYLKYLHEKANFLSKLKGKDHVETINAIKAFENRKATAAEGAILKAQSISEKKVGGD